MEKITWFKNTGTKDSMQRVSQAAKTGVKTAIGVAAAGFCLGLSLRAFKGGRDE